MHIASMRTTSWQPHFCSVSTNCQSTDLLNWEENVNQLKIAGNIDEWILSFCHRGYSIREIADSIENGTGTHRTLVEISFVFRNSQYLIWNRNCTIRNMQFEMILPAFHTVRWVRRQRCYIANLSLDLLTNVYTAVIMVYK